MKTTAIQVVPVTENFDLSLDKVSVVPQPDGPTEATTGWAVYERREDGTATWFADTGSEDHAMWIGQKLAETGEVDIEPQPWVQRRADLEEELIDAHEAQSNGGPFETWLRAMAANDEGTLQNAAKELIALKGI